MLLIKMNLTCWAKQSLIPPPVILRDLLKNSVPYEQFSLCVVSVTDTYFEEINMAV